MEREKLIKRISQVTSAILFAIVFGAIIKGVSPILLGEFEWRRVWTLLLLLVGGLVGLIIGWVVGWPIVRFGMKQVRKAEGFLQKMSAQVLLSGAFGLIIGLIVAFFIGYALSFIPIIGSYMPVICDIVVGYLGMSLAVRKRDEWFGFLMNVGKNHRGNLKEKGKTRAAGYCNMPKVLDTSVIIDGRIADICKTGFVEGPLVIANFVLEELRHIADSSDPLKRTRGRRGLDMLNIIRNELDIEVEISEVDYPDIAEVDDKLVRLAQDLYGCVVTNDYNLNKVAALQGVIVLNINELANAIKPVVLPGERMTVTVVKEGKEATQGVAYLDDGTMIVVENGRRLMHQTVEVEATSVIQTNAGRMIFVKALS